METARYHRQILLPQIGSEGQRRLAGSRVLLAGCGALGCVIADQFARAGVGTLRIIDRDIVEPTNLQRQVLFDEEDARAGTPKSIAGAARLRRINSQIEIEPIVADLNATNIERLCGLSDGPWPIDLILDGTDNAQTRYLINDVSVRHGIPWIYGACVGTEGRIAAVRPRETPCLRCLFPEPPGPGELPTCDTAGVLATAATMTASMQVVAAIRCLIGAPPAAELITLDAWTGRVRVISTVGARRTDCVACGRGTFEYLDGRPARQSVALCGCNSVQVQPMETELSLEALEEKLSSAGRIERTPHLLRCELGEPANMRLTVFPDGRAIVHGTTDPARARSIYDRFVGN